MPTREQRHKIGQLFVVGFHGHEIDADITSLIRDYGIGTVILFRRNIVSAQQLQSLCLDLQRIARDASHQQPLFIAIDQENGLVTRISPPVAAQMPGPMTLAATTAGSLDAAYRVAGWTADMLRYFGIHVNYAPSADVNSEPLNPVIGVRSFGDDPEAASDLVLACARGLRDGRIVPCIKHFPGHGDTAVDSHHGLPVIQKTREELEKVELVPFRRAVMSTEGGFEMVMTAHISLPQLSPREPQHKNLPATLSPAAISILRNDFNFKGVIVTDCMEMDGVRATYGTVEASLMALQAGVDSVMICHTFASQTAAIDRICEALELGSLQQQRIDDSLQRMRNLKEKFTSWEVALRTEPPETLTAINEAGENLARQVYADAITLVRSQPGILPISQTARIVLVSPGLDVVSLSGAADQPQIGQSFEAVIRHHNPGVSLLHIQFSNPPSGNSGSTPILLADEQWQQLEQADVVILTTQNARQSSAQRTLGLEIARRKLPVIAIATCAPYDFLQEEDEMGTYIVTYEPTAEAFRSAVEILYGGQAKGRLPIKYEAKRKN